MYRKLNDFEKEVRRLFERTNGHYELTEAGEALLIHAQKITESFDDIDRDVVGKDTELQGKVRITAPCSFAYYDLPRHFNELSKCYPEIDVELLISDVELNMTNRQADIAIRVTSTPPEHLVGREVSLFNWGVYAGKNYLYEKGRPTNLIELANHRIIGASGILNNYSAFQWLNKKQEKNITLRSDDLIAMSFLAKNNLGLAFYLMT